MGEVTPNLNRDLGDVNYNPMRLFIRLCACRGTFFQYPSKDLFFSNMKPLTIKNRLLSVYGNHGMSVCEYGKVKKENMERQKKKKCVCEK